MGLEQNIGVAIYTKKDYERLLEISDNREDMNQTWIEWRRKKDELKRNMRTLGVIVKEVKVNLDELVRYCRRKGIPNNGATRSQFVQQKLSGKI